MIKRNSGFSVVEGLVVVSLVILVGLVGYNLYSMNKARSDSTAQQKAIAEQEVPAAPEIKNASDLDKAAQTLDSVDVDQDQEDMNQLDTQTTF